MRVLLLLLCITIPTAAGCQSVNRLAQQSSVDEVLAEAGSQPSPLQQTSVVRLAGYQSESAEGSSQEVQPLNPPSAALIQPAEPVPLGSNLGEILTLDLIEQLAMSNNPALAEAAARVEAARGNWVQQGLPPNPEVGYLGQQLGSRGQAEQQGVFLGQEFVTGKKLRLNREVAAWEVQRAEHQWTGLRLKVLTDVRIGFYDVLIAQRRRELAKNLVDVATQGVSAAQARFQGEEVSEADPLRARIEADTARIVLQNSIYQHAEAWRRLTAVLGMPQLEIQPLDGDLSTEGIAISWQAALGDVLRQSPEVAAAMADVEAARWATQRAYAEVVPNIEVQAVIQDDRGTGGHNSNLQVTLPIPLINRNQGAIRRAQAEVAASQRALDKLALDLQSRLASTFQRYESARNQVDTYSREEGILQNAQRTLQLTRAGYQAEELGLLDLLNAQRTYFQTNLAYLDSLRQMWSAVFEIRGLLLTNSLQDSAAGPTYDRASSPQEGPNRYGAI